MDPLVFFNIFTLTNYLYETALNEVRLFLEPGNKKTTDTLDNALTRGVNFNLINVDPHCLADLILRCLRRLDIPQDISDLLIGLDAVNLPLAQAVLAVHQIIFSLDVHKLIILKNVIWFFRVLSLNSQVNLMTAANIATVAANFLPSDNIQRARTDLERKKRILQFLIENYLAVFNDS